MISFFFFIPYLCTVTSFTATRIGPKIMRTNHEGLLTISNNRATKLFANENEVPPSQEMEYKNLATSILSNFMQKEDREANDSKSNEDVDDPLANIDFKAPKISNVPIDTLASMLDYELYNKEWFVTGQVNPIYFADEFEFQDPDVKLSGIEEYGRGVNKLFDQKTSRAEIISTEVNTNMEDTITVTWRLSGKVKIGPGDGLTIKPYICYTDFKVDTKGSGLVTFQEDRFDIPQWDILLSALFPFLIGKVTSNPAPPVPVRDAPIMPKGDGIDTSPSDGGFNIGSMMKQLFN